MVDNSRGNKNFLIFKCTPARKSMIILEGIRIVKILKCLPAIFNYSQS